MALSGSLGGHGSGQLFLEYAAWIVDEEGTRSPIDELGILLTMQTGIDSVPFLNTGKNEPRGKS